MKVFIDTNIIISAFLFPKGKASKAYEKAVSSYDCYISKKTMEEIKIVFRKKFPEKIEVLSFVINMTLKTVRFVEDAEKEYPLENTIRDKKDIYVYRAAKQTKCDIILTGDKDFIDNKELDIDIMSPTEFLIYKE